MTTIVQLDQNDLRAELKNCISEFLTEIKELPILPEQPDRINFPEALELFNSNGIPTSKSWLYKKVMDSLQGKDNLPVKKFGRRLVFSRKELIAWLEAQTETPRSFDEIMTNKLAKVASSKQKKGLKHGKGVETSTQF
ncbi:MAG: hypothetical protein Q8928_02510 [Bacteroidota bacterium]|nr:hypothetical protein [Bacteroidota bacterium]